LSESFLNGRVTLHPGDCRDVLKTIPDCSIDSIVTDPPYALVSIVKRFGKPGAAPAKGNEAYQRASAGFMGKQWDTGETAFAVEFWAECLRVLKPGGHVVAFSGTRTYHRMACAIEDAGFEVRDMLSWLYGSGFPKSHSVQKAIEGQYECRFLPSAKIAELKSKHSLVELREGMIGSVLGFVVIPLEAERARLTVIGAAGDSLDQTDMCPLESTDGTFLNIDTLWNATSADPSDPTRRFITTTKLSTITQSKILSLLPKLNTLGNICGAGSALKPACEPICFGRKPLSGTVAANVLEHGTGAINIDGCRVGEGGQWQWTKPRGEALRYGGDVSRMPAADTEGVQGSNAQGRWPANVIHDGSEEVIAAFPDVDGAVGKTQFGSGTAIGTTGIRRTDQSTGGGGVKDSGSAARFFYTAKADSHDRIGSRHPTVKPVDLMQWLCRLVTPKGGTVLDPFAGTGTTGEAAFREGFNAVLIEREEEYQDDIRRRMALCMAGPDERKRESIKAKLGDVPFEPGSLFA
jgi:DNA modification methylase